METKYFKSKTDWWFWILLIIIASLLCLIGSILASSALSFDRIGIKFSDRKVLKSSIPLEISPKDIEEFLNTLKSINPYILIEE